MLCFPENAMHMEYGGNLTLGCLTLSHVPLLRTLPYTSVPVRTRHCTRYRLCVMCYASRRECALHLVKAMHLEHGGEPYFGMFDPQPCATPPYSSVHIRTRPYPALHTVSAMRNVLCQPEGMCYALGARGETLLFPPCAPFSPVCYRMACGTRC